VATAEEGHEASTGLERRGLDEGRAAFDRARREIAATSPVEGSAASSLAELVMALLRTDPEVVTVDDATLVLDVIGRSGLEPESRSELAWQLTHDLVESREAAGGPGRLRVACAAAEAHWVWARTSQSRRNACGNHLAALTHLADLGLTGDETSVWALVAGLLEGADESDDDIVATVKATAAHLRAVAQWCHVDTWTTVLANVEADPLQADLARRLARALTAADDEDQAGLDDESTGRLDRLRLLLWSHVAEITDDPHAHEWAGYLTVRLSSHATTWALDVDALKRAITFLTHALRSAGTATTRAARLRDRAGACEVLAKLDEQDATERLRYLRMALADSVEILDLAASPPSGDDLDRCRRIVALIADEEVMEFTAIRTGVRSLAEARIGSQMLSGVVADLVEVGSEFHAALWLSNDLPSLAEQRSYQLVLTVAGSARLVGEPTVAETRPGEACAFTLLGDTAGPATLLAECFDGADPVATLRFEIEVIPRRQVIGTGSTGIPTRATPPQVTLLIGHSDAGLTITALSQELGLSGSSWGPILVDSDRLRRVKELTSSIVDALFTWLQTGDVEAAARAEHEIVSAGSELGEHLVPADLRRSLADAIGRVSDVLIISDESWIPWELVVIGTTPKDSVTLCEAFTLTRWIRGIDSMRVPAKPLMARCVPAAVAKAAAPQLSGHFDALEPAGWKIVDSRTDRSGFLDDLLQIDAGLWHVVAHGRPPDSGAPRPELLLNLDDGSALELRDLTEQRCHRLGALHPFVFLCTCSSATGRPTVGSIDGWAAKLLRYGASGVVTTHWPVTVRAANLFSTVFYERVGRGDTVPAAVFAGRAEVRARLEGDPSWAAFCVFADTDLRLSGRAPLP
jgi:hypothetical protein